nr:hypothetical protein [Micromonospora sp. DSM 115978]
ASTSSDGDRAAAYLDEAVNALHTNWYQTGFQRVQTVRAVLGDSQHGQQLDRQLNELAAVVPLSGTG